jgi:hypothetical protein
MKLLLVLFATLIGSAVALPEAQDIHPPCLAATADPGCDKCIPERDAAAQCACGPSEACYGDPQGKFVSLSAPPTSYTLMKSQELCKGNCGQIDLSGSTRNPSDSYGQLGPRPGR